MPATYNVQSHTRDDLSYEVKVNWKTGVAYRCSCPHFQTRLAKYRGERRCKHFEHAETQHARQRYRDAVSLGKQRGVFEDADSWRRAFEARREDSDLTVAVEDTFRFAALCRAGKVTEATDLFLRMLWGEGDPT